MRKIRKQLGVWIGIGVMMVGLSLSLDLGTKVNQLVSKAIYKKAEIVVDVSKDLQTMPKPFNNLAQGGEESDGMLGDTVGLMSQLSPGYVRLDHIYDFYEVVKRVDGELKFDFRQLDQEVEAILQAGAKPLLALSYMPSELGDGTINPPDNWGEWRLLVLKTIEHYSGRAGKNINHVYYEVWNEPDLFGDFKTSGDRNYLEMYRQSALGASDAKNVNQFKLGGPATTGLYKNWIVALLELSRKEKLRLDFVSWHRYSLRVEDFSDDVKTLNKVAKKYPELALKEKLVTEWGFDPKNNSGYDTSFGAAHMMASVIEMIGGVHKAFVFEVKDGKDPEGKVFWGRYGLVTHESSGLQRKPRFEMMKWLNDLGEKRLGLSGEGSFVKGVAALKGKDVQVYLVNFDSGSSHFEAVPVIVKNLKPGNYLVVKDVFGGGKVESEVTITQGTWTGQVVMNPNEAVRLTFKSH